MFLNFMQRLVRRLMQWSQSLRSKPYFRREQSIVLEGTRLIFERSGPYFRNNCADSSEAVSIDWATDNPITSNSITWQTAIKQKQKQKTVNGSCQPSTPQALTHKNSVLSLPRTYWDSTKSDSIACQTAIQQKQGTVHASISPSTPFMSSCKRQSLTHEHPFLSLPQTYCWSKILKVEHATVLFNDRVSYSYIYI